MSMVTACKFHDFCAVFLQLARFRRTLLNNGHPLRDCSCTYAALPKLPISYRPLALAWAHQSTFNYGTETLVFVGGQVLETAKSEVGLKSKKASDQADVTSPWHDKALSVLKWLGLRSIKTVAAPIIGLISINKLTADYAEARGALGETCGGKIDGLLGFYHRLKIAWFQRLEFIAKGSRKKSVKAVTSAGGWLATNWAKLWH